MQDFNRLFPAKLLLFGEYALLEGSPALAWPLRRWTCAWAQGQGREARASRNSLVALRLFLQDTAPLGFDFERWQADASLWLHSDIPNGYGLGSSGAACAAILARYGLDIPTDTLALRHRLAAMESFWHGHSSGLDPLVSYLDAPVRHELGAWHRLQEEVHPAFCKVYLVDSAQRRQTTTLVHTFKSWLSDSRFRTQVLAPLMADNAYLVSHWLAPKAEEEADFWRRLRQLSRLQFEHFKPMVAAAHRPLWAELLAQEGPWAMKLCGAGGGGFGLIFAQAQVEPRPDWIEVPF